MAKKTRRARRPLTSPSVRPVTPAVASDAARPAAVPNGKLAASSPRKQVDFATEYYYVVHDLRNMGLIAGTMLIVLIALSFIIR